jgi:hypothetical protein
MVFLVNGNAESVTNKMPVNGKAESVTNNIVVVRRRLGAFTGAVFTDILSLQGGFPGRLWRHLLLYVGWCSWIPFGIIACWSKLAGDTTDVCFR